MIEGDIVSTVDVDRVSVLAVPVIQINTAGVCLIPEAFVKTGDKLFYRLIVRAILRSLITEL